MIIDTHTHICDQIFDRDRSSVIQRAKKIGVKAIISVSENLSDIKKNIELARIYKELKPAAGLYPTCLDLKEAQTIIAFIRKEQNHFIAIGEVGLDYWKIQKDVDREIQQQIFRSFINLSIELDLPLNIHSRSAGRQAIEILKEQGAIKVQMHAFDGKASSAMPGVEAGYFFSIPPSIVRSQQKQNLVKKLPLLALMVETDSPVLGPNKGERNEPENIIKSIRSIAEIKNCSEEKVIKTIFENTIRLYGERIIE